MGPKHDHGFPDKDAIVAFIRKNPGNVGTREIAREFGLIDKVIEKRFEPVGAKAYRYYRPIALQQWFVDIGRFLVV